MQVHWAFVVLLLPLQLAWLLELFQIVRLHSGYASRVCRLRLNGGAVTLPAAAVARLPEKGATWRMRYRFDREAGVLVLGSFFNAVLLRIELHDDGTGRLRGEARWWWLGALVFPLSLPVLAAGMWFAGDATRAMLFAAVGPLGLLLGHAYQYERAERVVDAFCRFAVGPHSQARSGRASG